MGPKKKAEFTPQDFIILETLSYQAGLALENALFYEEYGKSAAQLYHEKKLKDTLTIRAGITFLPCNSLDTPDFINYN